GTCIFERGRGTHRHSLAELADHRGELCHELGAQRTRRELVTGASRKLTLELGRRHDVRFGDVEAAAREEGEVGALAAVLVAVGCGGDGNEDGHAWVSDVRWRTKGRRQSWPSAPRGARTAGNCD